MMIIACAITLALAVAYVLHESQEIQTMNEDEYREHFSKQFMGMKDN